MKKLFYLFGAAFLLTSCNGSGPEYPTYETSTKMYTHYYTGQGSPVISEAQYAFKFNLALMTGTLTGSNIEIGNGETVKFDTKSVELLYGTSIVGSEYRLNNAASSGQSGFANVYVNQASLISNFVTYPYSNVDLVAGHTGGLAIVNGTLDGGTFKTFPGSIYYKGNTYTRITASGSTYQTEDIYYGVTINPKTNKATMVIYEAKFAEPAPKINFALLDLDINWTSTGYTITGINVVPQILEGAGMTPNERYIFDTITFQFRDSDLTQVEIAFTIANNTYSGTFSGSYIIKAPTTE